MTIAQRTCALLVLTATVAVAGCGSDSEEVTPAEQACRDASLANAASVNYGNLNATDEDAWRETWSAVVRLCGPNIEANDKFARWLADEYPDSVVSPGPYCEVVGSEANCQVEIDGEILSFGFDV